ncbi:hypothetical protein PTKIN_Ptkin14bG0011400 [Pterospermum kingtungense]
MVGCCCCSSRGVEINSAPAYYYYPFPRASDEHVPLSSHTGAASAFSIGLLIDTNLDVSVPDAYRPPPAPLPYDAVLGPPKEFTTIRAISLQTTNVDSSQETVAVLNT